MSLAVFGKEFIIINEEMAIYISFLIVLTLLISNLGETLAKQFDEMVDSIANSYSQGSQQKSKNLLNQLIGNYKNISFIIGLTSFEVIITGKLIKLKGILLNAIHASEIK